MERQTRQRQVLREVLSEADRPLSPNEVLEAARARLPRIGIATIYRQLKDLTAQGWLVSVDLPGEPARYELAGKEHHHHFHCRRCSRLFEVEGCGLTTRPRVPEGFRVERHEVLLYGLCAECAGA